MQEADQARIRFFPRQTSYKILVRNDSFLKIITEIKNFKMAEQQPLHSNSDQATTKETTIENGNCHQLGLSAPTWQVEESPVALNPSVVPPPPPPPPTKLLHCPRCDSTNTKFCYYNNYSLMQPR